MAFEKTCPVCGRSSAETEFIGFFCTDDYLAEKKLKLPSKIEIKVCKRCGLVSLNEKEWKNSVTDMLSAIALKLKEKGVDKIEIVDVRQNEMDIEIYVGSSKLSRTIPLFERRTLCDVHTKMARGYYEAIIQLRGDMAKIERVAKQLVSELNEKTFVTGYGEYKYGVDILAGSNEVTRKILSDLKIKTKVTRKVWGAKRGETIYRVTYLVKL